MEKTCPACGGSGQVAFFQGVSRFLLTWEECQECYGTGMIAARCSEEKKQGLPGKSVKPDQGKKDP